MDAEKAGAEVWWENSMQHQSLEPNTTPLLQQVGVVWSGKL